MDELFGYLCACWGVPLFVLAFVVLTTHGVRGALRRRGLSAGDPHCGNCRYIVRGVGSWQCPECGADLRQVGILTRDTVLQEPLPAGSRILLWLAAVPGPIMLFCFVLYQLLPIPRPAQWYVYLSDGDAVPRRGIALSGTGDGTAYGARLRGVSVYLYEPLETAIAEVDFDNRTWNWIGGGSTPLRLDTQQPDVLPKLVARLRDVRLVGDDDVLRDKALDVWSAVRAAGAGRPPRTLAPRRLAYMYGDMTLESAPPAWFTGLGMVACLITWAVGAHWLIRGYERDMARLKQHTDRVLEGVRQSIEAAAEPDGLGDEPADVVSDGSP